MPVDLIEYIADMQSVQTKMLHEQNAALAKISATVEDWTDSDKRQDALLEDIDARVSSLESDRKVVRAVLLLTWGAISAFAAVVAWLFPH